MVVLRERLVESVQLNHVGSVLKVVFSFLRVMGTWLESQVCDSLFSWHKEQIALGRDQCGHRDQQQISGETTGA